MREATQTSMHFAADLEGHLRAICAEAGVASPSGIGFRRTSSSAVDLRLFFAGEGALAAEDKQRLVARLGAEPIVAEARPGKAAVAVRLAEDYVQWLADALCARQGAGPPARGPLTGRRYVVNFLNPNAIKPLHIGHLRNVATGAGQAALLEAAGAEVVRQAYVCDMGRSVCEALAGYQLIHEKRASDPGAPIGEAADRLAGRCYAEYVATLPELDSEPVPGSAAGSAAAAGDPVARETLVRGDLADELGRLWLEGHGPTRALALKLTDGALAGQRASLARLGVTLDRLHLESASLPAVDAFLERGLASGLLSRDAHGVVSYCTGRSEYSRLPLLRSDGLPTEHARVIGLFLNEGTAAAADLPHGWIVVCGDEWSAAGEAELELARRLGADTLAGRVRVVAHGMVTLSGSKMKSRDGKALLIDDFIGELVDRPEIARLCQASDERVTREQVARIVAKGYFLCRSIAKSVEFRWDSFLDPTHNPAWNLAHAWCRVHGDQNDEAASVDPEALRVAVLQSFQIPPLVAPAAERFVGTELAKFAIGFAKWYLREPRDARLAGVVRAVLVEAQVALDLVQRPSTTSK